MHEVLGIGSQSEGVVETAATSNEVADNVDAYQDTVALVRGQQGLTTDTATIGEAGQTPGDADTHDGGIGVVGGLFEGIETAVHGYEAIKAHQKVNNLKDRITNHTATSTDNIKHLQTQRKAAIGDRRTAAIRGGTSALSMGTKAAEGGMHYYNALKDTGIDPIGISAMGDFASGIEETRRAIDSRSRQNRLGKISGHQGLSNQTVGGSGLRHEALKADHSELQVIQSKINSGEAELSDFHKMNHLIGPSARNEHTSPHQRALRGMQTTDQLSDIRTREQSQQGWKAGLAGTAAAGNFVAGAGNLTGGADLGITKVVGTTVAAGAGAVRSGSSIKERYHYAKNLGKAKNMGAALGKKKNRGWGWAMRQTIGDVYKVGHSVIANARGNESNVDWRAKHHMSTLDEQANNFRKTVASKATPDKYRTMQMPTRRPGLTADDMGLSATHATALSDLATRPVHLDASRVIDAASGANHHARPETTTAAGQMLDAMDVGRTGGATDRGIKGLWRKARRRAPEADTPVRTMEDFGGGTRGAPTDEATKTALMHSYVNRHNLRG